MRYGARRAELEQFERDGFFVRERAFSPGEIEGLRAAVERVGERVRAAADPSGSRVERIEGKRYERVLGSSVKWDWGEGSTSIRSMEPFRHLDPALEKLAEDPRLREPMLGLIGVDSVSLFTDKLNFKRPGGSPFPWHQDSPYWAFGCPHLERLASVGLYLDDATEENGCLWVVAGSHLQGILPSPKAGGVLNRLYTDVRAIRAGRPVPIAAPAGTAFFFHVHVVHGSAPNRTERSRRALYFTYQPAGLPLWDSSAPTIGAGEGAGAA
jgi:hypothetical protein